VHIEQKDLQDRTKRFAESESGEERINSSPNAAIHSVSSKRPLIGLNCSVTENHSTRKHRSCPEGM
jgi:hypothetical protein